MRRALLTLCAIGLALPLAAQSAPKRLRILTVPPCVGTTIALGDDWNTAAQGGTTNQTFCIAAGIHRLQSVQEPKAGQRFISRAGAVMSGARLLTGPTGSNPWVYTGQTQDNGDPLGSVCRSGIPECAHPEDVFIDDVRLLHVSTLGAVTTGAWFFNYGTDTIYLGTDPTGHKVEASVTAGAFINEGAQVASVWVEGLTIEKYANPSQKGAINAPNATGWTVTGSVVRWNHATGIGAGTASHVTNNNAYDNGQVGIGSYDSVGSVYERNVLAYNGPLYDPFWGAGGMKVAFQRTTLIRLNYSHHNFGPGIWCDIDCDGVTMQENLVTDNDQSGLFYEISFNGIIRYNTVLRNGFNADGGPASAGIFISSSGGPSGVQVYGNTVSLNQWGIFALQEARGTSPAEGVPWSIDNLSVHDNTVTQAGGGPIGFSQTVSDTTYFTSRNNHFEANTYLLQGSTSYFSWSDISSQSFATWQGYGNDSPVGSATTY